MALSISFKGKKVLVTGAARGLGKDLVEVLYKQDAIIWAVSRNPDNLQKLKDEFPNIHTVAADLSNWKETREALEGITGVEYLINNAGIATVGSMLEATEGHFDDMWNTNVKGVINVSQIVVADMLKRGQGGCIINVSSLGAKVAAPRQGIYGSTKAALDSLTKSMAVELGPHGIRVNSVNPGMFESDMTKNFLKNNPGGGPWQYRTPMKRLVENGEIINTILFLMSEHSPFIHGTTVLVDGGYACN